MCRYNVQLCGKHYVRNTHQGHPLIIIEDDYSMDADFFFRLVLMCFRMKFNGRILKYRLKSDCTVIAEEALIPYTECSFSFSVSHHCVCVCFNVSSGNWQRKTINYWAIKLFSLIWNDAMHLSACLGCSISLPLWLALQMY